MFLIGLQSTWVKRAFQCSNDNWKFDLVCGSERDIHKVGLENPNIGSTLNSIAKSFRTFAEVFAQVESNFLQMPILNNKIFGYGNMENNNFDDDFFDGWADIDYIRNITWNSLIENENLMSIENLRNSIGVQLTQERYLKLKIGWNRAKKKYLIQGHKGKSLNEFVKWERKGSKCFRDIMTKNSRIEQGKNLIKLP